VADLLVSVLEEELLPNKVLQQYIMAIRGGQSKEYDYLFKLLIIGDSGKKTRSSDLILTIIRLDRGFNLD